MKNNVVIIECTIVQYDYTLKTLFVLQSSNRLDLYIYLKKKYKM